MLGQVTGIDIGWVALLDCVIERGFYYAREMCASLDAIPSEAKEAAHGGDVER